MAAISPPGRGALEIRRDRIDVRTIDGSGNEFDFHITAYIVGPKGGFLWPAERPIETTGGNTCEPEERSESHDRVNHRKEGIAKGLPAAFYLIIRRAGFLHSQPSHALSLFLQ